MSKAEGWRRLAALAAEQTPLLAKRSRAVQDGDAAKVAELDRRLLELEREAERAVRDDE